jgi:hypothetical protein
MNYLGVIRHLRAELKRVTQAIETLEALEAGKPPTRRGRKSMPAAERLEVSARLKRYWAKWRRERSAGDRP